MMMGGDGMFVQYKQCTCPTKRILLTCVYSCSPCLHINREYSSGETRFAAGFNLQDRVFTEVRCEDSILFGISETERKCKSSSRTLTWKAEVSDAEPVE